ncbi:MAG TPA: hypothetical protein VK489_02500 [Ferruginibacter sp.]|nr:hypothetical protein [Ferruginibacter sp.]
MLKPCFSLLILFSFFLHGDAKAQQHTFNIEDVMNKVKEYLPEYKFRHYKWPLPPDACYGGQTLAPEEIDVTVDFKNGSPSRIMLKNMDLKNNPTHLTILDEVLKMVDGRYPEWYAKFYKASIKSKKYDNNLDRKEGDNLLRFEYIVKDKKFSCVVFFFDKAK